MAKQLFTNNAKSTLSAGITDVATVLSVAAGHGARFPSPAAGDWFLATLVDTSGNIEIVKVTARTTDAFTTIVRAQEGTTAIAFASGSKCELRATKGTLERIPQTAGLTNTRVPYADASGNLVDDAGLTYDGSILTTEKLVGSDATDATSPTTGAMKTAGGLGVAKALHVGGLANVIGDLTVNTNKFKANSEDGVVSGAGNFSGLEVANATPTTIINMTDAITGGGSALLSGYNDAASGQGAFLGVVNADKNGTYTVALLSATPGCGIALTNTGNNIKLTHTLGSLQTFSGTLIGFK